MVAAKQPPQDSYTESNILNNIDSINTSSCSHHDYYRISDEMNAEEQALSQYQDFSRPTLVPSRSMMTIPHTDSSGVTRVPISKFFLHPYHPCLTRTSKSPTHLPKPPTFFVQKEPTSPKQVVSSSSTPIPGSPTSNSSSGNMKNQPNSSSLSSVPRPWPVNGTFFNSDTKRFFQEHPFRMAVFPMVQRHPTELYALALEVARQVGYRDTYTMFRRYGDNVEKYWATEQEKQWMSEHGIITTMNKYREIAIVKISESLDTFGISLVHPESTLAEARELLQDGIKLSKQELERIQSPFEEPGSDIMQRETESRKMIDEEDNKENIELLQSRHVHDQFKALDMEPGDSVFESFSNYNKQVQQTKSILCDWLSSCDPKMVASINTNANSYKTLHNTPFPIALMQGQYQSKI
jgi:hypothetical protein